MLIGGVECLVICFCLALMGDTPALKTMVGQSPSVSRACYVNMPCMICETKMDNLELSIVDDNACGDTRTIETLRDFLRGNSGEVGAPNVAWNKAMMKHYGFLRIPVLLQLHNQPSSMAMGLDSMHAIFRGVLVKHFLRLMKKLTTGDGVDKRSWQDVWGLISVEFGKYCRLNGVSAFWNFNNKKEFKLRMTAGSMREFARVSPDILKKIGLIPKFPEVNNATTLVNWRYRIRQFNHWCIHVKVASMVEQHRISSVELKALDNLISQLLVFFYAEFRNTASSKVNDTFITINVHYYRHFVEKFMWLGPMRVVANNSREHLIQKIKPYYRNTNYKSKELSVFSRYRIGLAFDVYHILHAGNSLQFRR